VYLLPAANAVRTEGSCTASNRSLQWRERVIEPLFDSRSIRPSCTRSPAEMGLRDQLLGRKGGRQNIRLVKVKNYEEPDLEDVLRNEINAARGRSLYRARPPRPQAHMRNMHLSTSRPARARAGTRRRGTTSPGITSACPGRATARPS